jgi:Cupin
MAFGSGSPFDDALEDLRVSGSVLLFESYTPPWAITVPGEGELRQLLGVGAEIRILPFHLVLEGSFELTPRRSPRETVSAHEVVISTGGDEHLMSSGHVRKPTCLRRSMPANGRAPGHSQPALLRPDCSAVCSC